MRLPRKRGFKIMKWIRVEELEREFYKKADQ